MMAWVLRGTCRRCPRPHLAAWEPLLGVTGSVMASESIAGRGFSEFVEKHGRVLQHALVAALGPDAGAEATSEALVYGWEHWSRVGGMDNPVGFLFTVGRNWGRRQFRRSALQFPAPAVVHQSDPRVEPALPGALATLSERQRVATVLVHGAGWTLAEVADLLGVDRGTVRKHAERGLRKLRAALEVSVDA
jgi:RNA polymerase sigma factor (sigma-70 family)